MIPAHNRLLRAARAASKPAETLRAQAEKPAAQVPLESADLLKPSEAAKRLGIGVRALERWRSTGDGPSYIRFTSKTLRYKLDDLQAFIAVSSRKNTSE